MFGGIILAGLLLFIFWGNKSPQPGPAAENVNLQPIEEAYERILQSSITAVNGEQLLEGALRGMTATLRDPYSTYFSKTEAIAHHESLADERVGVGIEVMEKDGRFIVVSPLKEGPAEKAGVQPFDEIVQVDDVKMDGKSFGELLSSIRGKEGTNVKLVVYREREDKHYTFTMIRQSMEVITVKSKKLEQEEKSIGVVEISVFGEKTAEEWKKQTQKLIKEGIDGLLIDVRSNPGGYLGSVQQIASSLLEPNKVFTYMQDPEGVLEPLTVATEKETDYVKKMRNLPVVLLQNSGSASASEVLAGAIQGNDRGIIAGTTSFGKGTVQETWKLSNGGEVKLSSHRWLTPERKWIHGKGIKVDLEVEQPALFELRVNPATSTSELGDFNEDVAYAQKVLNAFGEDSLREDGFFDGQTKQAVVTFMHKRGKSSSGKMDIDFYTVLHQEISKFQADKANDKQAQMAIGYLFHVLK
ncbi:S41 family peptidase [Paenisporosarcina cavernae]|uniref:S41 family peptidase n=1 Tax=Paenisporosarcina cavernae TaxID=2320858 RepID=UPI001EE5049E|nr:S41 family peptidase [Paenisporosarcina cavernae]